MISHVYKIDKYISASSFHSHNHHHKNYEYKQNKQRPKMVNPSIRLPSLSFWTRQAGLEANGGYFSLQKHNPGDFFFLVVFHFLLIFPNRNAFLVF